MTQSIPSGNAAAQRRRNIGLLADWFDEHYQLTILRTAEEAVAQRGSSLVSFGGGILGSTTRNSERRQRAFDLVRPENVDGAILLSGTMVNELGPEAVQQLLVQLQGIPLCAIGIELPGVPSILVDNQAGIDQAMAHLVDRHEARRVAFIRGPSMNKEAESRFAAYQAALQRANTPFDAQLVYQGDFLQDSGKAAVKYWLNAGVVPDAIIAANDEMALGALRQLTRSGKSVPSDVALIGFDDVEGAGTATPPLTTVRQPLRDVAVAAVRTIMDQLLGREVPKVQLMQTHLVIRESCGCALRLSATGQSLNPPSSRTLDTPRDFASAFARKRQSLKAELQRAARGEFQSLGAWDDQLLDSFAEQLESGEPKFLEQLSSFVASTADSGGKVSRWHSVVGAIRRYSIPCCDGDPELLATAEDLLQDARVATADAVERNDARKRIELERFQDKLTKVGAALTGSFNIEELTQEMQKRLPSIGVKSCYLAVYDPFNLSPSDQPRNRARLIGAFDDGKALEVDRAPFATDGLAPPKLWPPARLHHFSVLPLFLKGVDLGFALVECEHTEGSVLEFVRKQLSIGLYGSLLGRHHSLFPDSTDDGSSAA